MKRPRAGAGQGVGFGQGVTAQISSAVRPRLVLVHNPRSSQHEAVAEEVLAPARELKGWLVGKFEVLPTTVDENAKRLAEILREGDLVVSAGGDGTATIAANGVLLSEKEVTLAVLPYGNFNDMARTLGAKGRFRRGRSARAVRWRQEEFLGLTERFLAGEGQEIWPLEALVDGRHWRYAPCYLTLGLFAESTAVFDDEKVRGDLRKGRAGVVFSVWQLAKWYFKNRGREFLPVNVKSSWQEKEELAGFERNVKSSWQYNDNQSWQVKLNGVALGKGTTDYLAVNGRTMARLMRGGKWFLEAEKFWSGTGRLKSFWRLVWFMMRSVLVRVPGRETKGDVIEFAGPSEVEIHAEGEYERLKGVKKIEIKKAARRLKVVS